MPQSPRSQGGQTRRQEQAIVELISGATIDGAAAACKVSTRTLKRWLADDDFQREYKAARRRLIESATGKLREAMTKAVGVLDKIAGDTNAAPTARVTAASRILELGLRSHEIEDLADRLSQLERDLERSE